MCIYLKRKLKSKSFDCYKYVYVVIHWIECTLSRHVHTFICEDESKHERS